MIRGKNIELRAVEPTDVDLLYAWENDESLWHLSNTLTPFSRFDIEQYVLNAGQDIFAAKQLRLMIVISDKAIGSIDLFDFEPAHKRAGVGIMVVKNERNKGYASEALHVLVEYCFNVLHLHQLFCNISADNQASISLFSKEGFEIIGLKKEWLLIRNKL